MRMLIRHRLNPRLGARQALRADCYSLARDMASESSLGRSGFVRSRPAATCSLAAGDVSVGSLLPGRTPPASTPWSADLTRAASLVSPNVRGVTDGPLFKGAFGNRHPELGIASQIGTGLFGFGTGIAGHARTPQSLAPGSIRHIITMPGQTARSTPCCDRSATPPLHQRTLPRKVRRLCVARCASKRAIGVEQGVDHEF